MFNKREMNSMDFIEVFLILFFIILVSEILYFIGNNLSINTLLYNVLVISIILLTIIVISITVFQFIKIKYVETVKVEVKEELDSYKVKLMNKIAETNNKVVHFEVNYSKKLTKIMKDYAVKAKEIESIKKELNAKLVELDWKAAELEIETCVMKVENLKGKPGINIKQLNTLYDRIIELNDRYPGICDEKILW